MTTSIADLKLPSEKQRECFNGGPGCFRSKRLKIPNLGKGLANPTKASGGFAFDKVGTFTGGKSGGPQAANANNDCYFSGVPFMTC